MTDEQRAAPPREGYRAMSIAPEYREDAVAPRLVGYFARFGAFNEIDSHTEGRFMERIAPGAFAKTFTERQPKVLFQHGKDPQVGDQPIAAPQVLREEAAGPYFEAELLDGVPPLIVSGLRAGQYGVSYRFQVVREDWDPAPRKSPDNPNGLPERTIREAKVFEYGPVTFPADAMAPVQVRSLSDEMAAPIPEPDAPSVDAAAVPHLDPERRDDPEPPPLEVAVVEPQEPQRSAPVDLTTIEDKRARYDELNAEIRTQAGAYPGPLPEDEQVKWNANVDERDKLGKDIAAWETRQQAVIDAVAADTVERPYVAPKVNQINRKSEADLHSPESRSASFEGRVAEFRDDAMRITEKAVFPYGLADTERSRDKIADLLDHHDSPDGELARRIKYTGSPVYLRAFEKIIKAKGSTIGLTPEEQRGTALAVGVDATGGFTVPFAFDPTVIAIGSWSGAVNPYRRSARVVQIIGTDTWNALTATAVVATRTTEAAAAVEQGPTFAQPQYVVTRVQGQITASFEMFQDRTDLASEMAALIAEAKDNEEEASMATGATAAANIGVGPVSGTSGAFTGLSTAGASLAAADALSTEAALPVRHRFNAQWYMNRAVIRRFQALETTGGQLFGGNQYPAVGNPAVDGAGNTGLRLLGYPVNESPSLPTATTTTITIATLANPTQYVIVDRIGMSVQFIPFIFNSSALATGQQALYFMYRNTAKPINVDGGRVLRYV